MSYKETIMLAKYKVEAKYLEYEWIETSIIKRIWNFIRRKNGSLY